MDKAKAAVSDFMAKAGHHDTTVHEKVAPAVTHESVNHHKHENITTAVDKEIHQDHYHTSVQPVHDREVLPEQHTHNLGAVEHREFRHGNDRDIASRLEQEAAQFTNKCMEGETKETRSAAPTVQGEHIHHHVHETIQPVVHKETIQPHVVHTTVPIHETHHNAAQHHTASALPAVSMADFKKQGGVLGGREERYDGFEGEPRTVGGALGGEHSNGHHGHHEHGTTGTSGLTGSHDRHNGSGLTGNNDRYDESNRDRYDESNRGTTGTTAGKPSLMDKLNPKVDANGDGKAGFMK